MFNIPHEAWTDRCTATPTSFTTSTLSLRHGADNNNFSIPVSQSSASENAQPGATDLMEPLKTSITSATVQFGTNSHIVSSSLTLEAGSVQLAVSDLHASIQLGATDLTQPSIPPSPHVPPAAAAVLTAQIKASVLTQSSITRSPAPFSPPPTFISATAQTRAIEPMNGKPQTTNSKEPAKIPSPNTQEPSKASKVGESQRSKGNLQQGTEPQGIAEAETSAKSSVPETTGEPAPTNVISQIIAPTISAGPNIFPLIYEPSSQYVISGQTLTSGEYVTVDSIPKLFPIQGSSAIIGSSKTVPFGIVETVSVGSQALVISQADSPSGTPGLQALISGATVSVSTQVTDVVIDVNITARLGGATLTALGYFPSAANASGGPTGVGNGTARPIGFTGGSSSLLRGSKWWRFW